MTALLDEASRLAGACWAWLKKDYRWLWLVLFPIGLVLLLARWTSPSVRVISPESLGADEKKGEVLDDLHKADDENKVQRDVKVEKAKQDHAELVDDLLERQRKEDLDLTPNVLQEAMKKAGRDARR